VADILKKIADVSQVRSVKQKHGRYDSNGFQVLRIEPDNVKSGEKTKVRL